MQFVAGLCNRVATCRIAADIIVLTVTRAALA
jgi:hypothetical protein